MKVRNMDKLNYYNDSTRTLLESIMNNHVLSAIKVFISKNDLEDVILIGGLAVSYYTKPYRSADIDILVRDKKTFKYFPNNQYKNGTKLDIYDITDLNITSEQFDDIKNHCVTSDGIQIISPSHLMSFFLKDYFEYLRCADFLLDNCPIVDDIIKKYTTVDEYKKYDDFLIYSKKNYRMKYIKKFNQMVNCKIYEGKSGYAQVDDAFDDWVKNTKNLNQVLIGGMAFLDYVPDRTTEDIDFLFLTEDDIPTQVNGFKKTRTHGFKHIQTHVELEVLSPEFLNINKNIIKIVFDSAYDRGNYKIATPSSIIVLKLKRLSGKDRSDIKKLVDNYDVDIKPYIPYLSDKELENLDSLKSEINL
jgi:hypothetical protein